MKKECIGITFEDIKRIVNGLDVDNIKAILNNYVKKVNFTEEFLREYIDLLNLGLVFIFQDVSFDFIREFITNDYLIHALFGKDWIRDNDKLLKELEERFYNK